MFVSKKTTEKLQVFPFIVKETDVAGIDTLRFRPSQIIEQAKAIAIDKCVAKLRINSQCAKVYGEI